MLVMAAGKCFGELDQVHYVNINNTGVLFFYPLIDCMFNSVSSLLLLFYLMQTIICLVVTNVRPAKTVCCYFRCRYETSVRIIFIVFSLGDLFLLFLVESIFRL